MKVAYYFLRDAFDENQHGHPQKVVEELGIDYKKAVPQSIADMWQFWDCSNIPDNLPRYIEIKERNAEASIGYGLSEDDADSLNRTSNA